MIKFILRKLLRDQAGNTMAMIAAALVPLLAMLGGGIDMGRSYMSQNRLQQACDAGVLAARKKLGSQIVVNGIVPAGVADVGNRFFDANFQSGAYGTTGRDFQMVLETDGSISATAKAAVPTSVMKIFGYLDVPVQATCEARLNFSNTDIMFVLDTTGSMNDTNPGDSVTRLQALRSVVKSFHAQLEANKKAGTRMRYGFVPYSTNVNVGGLLKSGWMVDNWTYQGREAHDTGTTATVPVSDDRSTFVSGSTNAITNYTSSACPSDTAVWTLVRQWTDPDGTQNWEYIVNGNDYNCAIADGGRNNVSGVTYVNYRFIYSHKDKGTKTVPVFDWHYKPMAFDVTAIKGPQDDKPLKPGKIITRMGGSPDNPQNLQADFRGCIEERSTYEITDYTSVDLTKALDLDIDLVPTPGRPETQWRPMFHEISWERGMNWDGTGAFSVPPVFAQWDYLMAQWAGTSACPSPAQKLTEMSAQNVADYVDALVADGSTYHDIGMIWGGRLISPTGLFAAENVDEPNKTTSRNLIFLTDGETAPLDISYASYGIEPLDQRRWHPGGALTLTETVEKRFGVACDEVKKRNVTVWVIGFGTSLNPVMTDCAGPGHAFEAADAAQLQDIFSRIAASIGDLRIAK